MSGISDAEVVSALRRQMTIAAARQVAAAGNLANIDTPNFKAVEVSFADALDSKVAAPVATQPGHLGQGATSPIRAEEIRDTPARRDGNTVVLDRELLTMSRASGDFSAAQTALAAKFRLVRYAINEGR
jgi:flagellar basal-body rod protein FlgB